MVTLYLPTTSTFLGGYPLPTLAFLSDDPLPLSPCSMYLVGTVFWLSERAKDMQTVLEKDYKLPTYAIFIVIAIATIVVGLILGGVSTNYILPIAIIISVVLYEEVYVSKPVWMCKPNHILLVSCNCCNYDIWKLMSDTLLR